MKGPQPGKTGTKYIPGVRYCRLVILAYRDVLSRTCLCDCGQTCAVKIADLCSGDTRSCGCLARETTVARNSTHGHAARGHRTSTYKAWVGMRKRCLDTHEPSYVDYGARGITIDPAWDAYGQFYADMGEKPAGLSLERTDNNGPYSASNCIWGTKKQQARNTRANFLLTYEGKTQCLAAWAEELGVPASRIQARLRILGWTVEHALTKGVSHV